MVRKIIIVQLHKDLNVMSFIFCVDEQVLFDQLYKLAAIWTYYAFVHLLYILYACTVFASRQMFKLSKTIISKRRFYCTNFLQARCIFRSNKYFQTTTLLDILCSEAAEYSCTGMEWQAYPRLAIDVINYWSRVFDFFIPQYIMLKIHVAIWWNTFQSY